MILWQVFDESGNGLDIDESAETVIEGTVRNAEGLTWRLDVNGVLYLEGTGKFPDESLYYEAKDNKGKFSDYSVTALVIGDGISGELYDRDYICSSKNLQNVVIGKGISKHYRICTFGFCEQHVDGEVTQEFTHIVVKSKKGKMVPFYKYHFKDRFLLLEKKKYH